jgi:hypothetical protein
MDPERDALAADDPNLGGDEETLTEARESGWTPKEDFRGNPDHWVDAKTWVEKGRQLAPLMKQQNAGLKKDLQAERDARVQLEARLRANEAALAAIQESQFESTVLDVKEMRKEIKAQIAQASRDGEHDRVADLTEKLIDLKEPEKPVKVNGEQQPVDRPVVDPHYAAWKDRNSWYWEDHRKSGFAEGVGRELALKGLKGAEFYAALDKELAKEFGTRRGGVDRQEGARNGGGGSGARKSYHDLPAEARAACDDFANKLVGPKKKYQKVEDWRAAYATKYFAGEQ